MSNPDDQDTSDASNAADRRVGSGALLGAPCVVMQLWEAYERDGQGCALYLKKADAEACDAFEKGCDRVVQSNVLVSAKDIMVLQSGGAIFA